MKFQLSVEAENKYYSNELTNADLRKELISNGFKQATNKNGEITDITFEGKRFKNIGLRQHENFEVYMEIEFE